MNYLQGLYKIEMKREIADSVFDMYINAPHLTDAKAGQFMHIKPDGLPLRRPIAICETIPEQGLIRIVFEVKGSGTKELSELEKGDKIDILGPLGNGFELLPKLKKALFVGGGTGVCSLLKAVQHYKNNAAAILGFKSVGSVLLENDFNLIKVKTFITTNDGSYGEKGNSTDMLEQLLKATQFDIVYACGPNEMLKAVAEITAKAKVKCQVSLEEKMGCGVGACHICVCKTKHGADNTEKYARICCDGPVFEAERVVF